MLRGSEVSKDSYHSPVKKYKQLKIYKLSQINSGQFTFKSGSSFTQHAPAPANCSRNLRYDLQMNWNDNLHYNAVL